jgi:N utilization substance protein A
MDKEAKTALVTVDDDQLSLAIGKKGQNVRLASKLTGWEIDIKPKNVPAEGEARAAAEAVLAKPSVQEEASGDISSVEGVGEKTKALLVEAGLDTVAR